MDAIVAYDLFKQYGNIPALCGLNLQIPMGRSFACVGRENSGKTTLIHLLSGLCRPTAGECTVLGLSPFFETEKLHACVGTVLATAKLYENLSLSENLKFFAGINGIEENDALDRISFLLHRLDIWEGRDEKIDDLPTGVVRRASLARALIHRPRVLLMDEPAGGLDREARESIQELFSYLVSEEGAAVLLCTKNMEYAQQLSDGFALLRDGAVMAKGDLESLRKGAGVPFQAVLRMKEGEAPSGGFRFTDGCWKKEINSKEELPKIISDVVTSGNHLYEARLAEPSLEEIYAAYLAGGVQRAGVINEQNREWQEDPDESFTDSSPAESLPEADSGEALGKPEYEDGGAEGAEEE